MSPDYNALDAAIGIIGLALAIIFGVSAKDHGKGRAVKVILCMFFAFIAGLGLYSLFAADAGNGSDIEPPTTTSPVNIADNPVIPPVSTEPPEWMEKLPPQPCAESFADVAKKIRLPKNDYYFPEYRLALIDAPKGHSVNGYFYPDDGSSFCNPRHGEQVIVLAEYKSRACIIVISDWTACWVNKNYVDYLD